MLLVTWLKQNYYQREIRFGEKSKIAGLLKTVFSEMFINNLWKKKKKKKKTEKQVIQQCKGITEG